MYNVKNYTEPGGEKTVIGGTLEIKDGAEVVGLSAGGGGGDLPHGLFGPIGYVSKLSSDATLATVITAVNDILKALNRHVILQGSSLSPFTFVEHPTITHEILKANTEACEVTLGTISGVLVVKGDLDRLTAFESNVYPYAKWGAHKYIAVQYQYGKEITYSMDPQVCGEQYFGSAFKEIYGMEDEKMFNALLPLDLLKEGYNRGALSYALEDYRGEIVDVIFEKA